MAPFCTLCKQAQTPSPLCTLVLHANVGRFGLLFQLLYFPALLLIFYFWFPPPLPFLQYTLHIHCVEKGQTAWLPLRMLGLLKQGEKGDSKAKDGVS